MSNTITLEIPLRAAGKLAAVALAHGYDLATYLAKDAVRAAESGELAELAATPAPEAPAATPEEKATPNRRSA